MSLLEAMSYGKIVMAADIPSCHEALGDSGVWVPYEDSAAISCALKRIYENYDDLKWQENANYLRAKNLFSWESTTRLYIDFLDSLVNNLNQ